LTDRHGTPLHVTIHSASPHEVTLIEPLIRSTPIGLPRRTRLIYDTAADSGPLRQRLRGIGVRLISPFNKRRNKAPRQLSKRDRGHYRNRWKIERTFAWLKNLRRLTTRWDYHDYLHLGFWQLGCLFSILRTF